MCIPCNIALEQITPVLKANDNMSTCGFIILHVAHFIATFWELWVNIRSPDCPTSPNTGPLDGLIVCWHRKWAGRERKTSSICGAMWYHRRETADIERLHSESAFPYFHVLIRLPAHVYPYSCKHTVRSAMTVKLWCTYMYLIYTLLVEFTTKTVVWNLMCK